MNAAACQRSGERDLLVSSPIRGARLHTYTFLWGGRDSLSLQLESGRPLSSVVDLSVFGSLRPGMDAAAARRAVGPPASSRKDIRGTLVDVFPTPAGAAEVGCERWDYAERPEDCSWTLYGIPTKGVESVFVPAVRELVRVARAERRPRNTSFDVYVCADGGECVHAPVVTTSDTRLRWSIRPGVTAVPMPDRPPEGPPGSAARP